MDCRDFVEVRVSTAGRWLGKTATMKLRIATAACLLMSAMTHAADPMPANPALPTLWIVGDSTVHQTGKTLSQFSWGDLIDKEFDESKLNVVNRARGGRSSRTFITEGLWEDTVKWIKKGDFLLIQMGHNDASPVVDKDRCRGSLPGTGEETQVVDNNVRNIRETVHTFGWYMRDMVKEAQAKGATVIVLSPVPRAWKEGQTEASEESKNYTKWAGEVAQQTGALFVDLNSRVLAKWQGWSPKLIKSEFFTPLDGTHFSGAGARVNMQCVLEGLRDLKPNPLTAFMNSPNVEPVKVKPTTAPATTSAAW